MGEIAEGASIDLDVPPLGVGVLVARGGRYLLGLRRGTRGAGTWLTPGGEVRRSEGVLDCAVRELKEETGLEGERPRVVAESVSRLDDGRDWRSVFVAVDVRPDREAVVREPEKCATWGWFSPLEVPEPLFPPVVSILRSTALSSVHRVGLLGARST